VRQLRKRELSEMLADGCSTIGTTSHVNSPRKIRAPLTLNAAFLEACLNSLPHSMTIQLLELVSQARKVGSRVTVEKAGTILLPQHHHILSLFTSVVTL